MSKVPDTPALHIVFGASEQHRAALSAVHFGSLEEIGNLGMYGRAKLAAILGFKYGLVECIIKPNGDNIYALSVRPGAVSLQHACPILPKFRSC